MRILSFRAVYQIIRLRTQNLCIFLSQNFQIALKSNDPQHLNYGAASAG